MAFGDTKASWFHIETALGLRGQANDPPLVLPQYTCLLFRPAQTPAAPNLAVSNDLNPSLPNRTHTATIPLLLRSAHLPAARIHHPLSHCHTFHPHGSIDLRKAGPGTLALQYQQRRGSGYKMWTGSWSEMSVFIACTVQIRGVRKGQ